MKREIILAEWRRARESMKAAELLTREDCYADAVSRTYYAVLHAAKAALQVYDVAPESHAGVGRMFGLHLVRTGEIEKEWAKHLGQSLDERLAADYDPELIFSRQDALRECRETRKFLRRIRRYLLDKGITESELRRRHP
jgi:uncharacterized protein (UPF0332 family)